MKETLGRIGALVALRLRVSMALWIVVLIQSFLLPCVFLFILSRQGGGIDIVRATIGLVCLSSLSVVLRRVANMAALDMASGRLSLLATTRVSPTEILVSRLIDGILISVVAAGPLFVAMAFGVIPRPSSAGWITAYLCAALFFSALGAVIARLIHGLPMVNLALNLATLGCVVFCPLFYTMNSIKPAQRSFADHLPPTLEVEALMAAWHHRGPELQIYGQIALWALAMVAFAWCANRGRRGDGRL